MNDRACISCGSQLNEVDPDSWLCRECAEDMGIDDDYLDYEEDDDE